MMVSVAIAVVLTAPNCGMTVSAAKNNTDISIQKENTQYIIDPNGAGDFLTIQARVDHASD